MKTIQTHPSASRVLGPSSDTLLVGGRQTSIGTVPEGSEARQVYQGPMVPGPWAYAVAHAVVIDNSGLAAAERARAIPLDLGEVFQIDNMPGTWRFRAPDRRKLEGDGPKLERVS